MTTIPISIELGGPISTSLLAEAGFFPGMILFFELQGFSGSLAGGGFICSKRHPRSCSALFA
jgi:hypothetical protein